VLKDGDGPKARNDFCIHASAIFLGRVLKFKMKIWW